MEHFCCCFGRAQLELTSVTHLHHARIFELGIYFDQVGELEGNQSRYSFKYNVEPFNVAEKSSAHEEEARHHEEFEEPIQYFLYSPSIPDIYTILCCQPGNLLLQSLNTKRSHSKHTQYLSQTQLYAQNIHRTTKGHHTSAHETLLQQHRRSLASLLRCEIRELLEFLGAHLSKGSE